MYKPLVLTFNQISESNVDLVGNQGLIYRQLIDLKVPIAKGFVVTNFALKQFLEETNFYLKLKKLSKSNPEIFLNAHNLAQGIKKILSNAQLPFEIVTEIINQYAYIDGKKKIFTDFGQISIRPIILKNHSKIALPIVITSGEANLIEEIKSLWINYLTQLDLFKPNQQWLKTDQLGLCLAVQQHPIQSLHGFFLTFNPQNGDRDQIYGQVVVNNHHVDFLMNKKTASLIGSSKHLPVLPLGQIAEISSSLDKQFFFPQKCWFFVDDQKIAQVVFAHSEGTTNNHNPTQELSVQTEKTLTKVYLQAHSIPPDFSHVGLNGVILRADDLFNLLSTHTMGKSINHNSDQITTMLSAEIEKLAHLTFPGQLIYALSDLHNSNSSLLGFRGMLKHLLWPELLKVEITALVLAMNHCTNISLLLPFCRDINELIKLKSTIIGLGLQHNLNFAYWFNLSTPANVLQLKKIIKEGVDCIFLNVYELTSLTLGVDPTNERAALLYNELNPAMLRTYQEIIDICSFHSIPIVVSSEGSKKDELLELFVKHSVFGITTTLENYHSINKTLSSIEERVTNDKIKSHAKFARKIEAA